MMTRSRKVECCKNLKMAETKTKAILIRGHKIRGKK